MILLIYKLPVNKLFLQLLIYILTITFIYWNNKFHISYTVIEKIECIVILLKYIATLVSRNLSYSSLPERAGERLLS
jgi:hypothetical protein